MRATAEAILKNAQSEYAKTQPRDFCKRNLMLRFLNTKDSPPADCETLPLKELEALVDKTNAETMGNKDPWGQTLLGTHAAIESVKSMFDKDFERLRSSEASDPTKALQEIARIKATRAPDRSEASSMFSMICLKETPLDSTNCVKALKSIEQRASTAETGVANIELWEELYSNRKYDEGLRLAALKLKSRMDGNFAKDANIFEDLQSSFRDSGMTPAAAVEATWNTLGAISNGGQNTSKRTDTFDPDWTLQKSVSLNLIAASMTYIDMKKEDKGYPLYSYPKEVQTTCNTQKPYHFWMSAYLARELRKQNISEDTAERAVYIAEQGYQIRRGAAATTNSILTREPFDPAHQIVRTDLAFAAAGAVFGAQSMNKNPMKNLNVSAAIVSLIDAGAVKKAIPKAEAEKLNLLDSYFKWTEIFAPEAALSKIKKQRR